MNNKKLAITLVPLVAISFIAFLALRQLRTDIVLVPRDPDTNTDLYFIKTVEDAETLLVQQGREQRRGSCDRLPRKAKRGMGRGGLDQPRTRN